eukprot:scaffold353_cov185-Amphora_coffeaeformis.AAC.55
MVRITKKGETRWRDIFTRGDVLLLTPEMNSMRQFGGGKYAANLKDTTPIPKECLVVDVGKDWMTVGVGASWPVGLWEARKFHYQVRLDRAAPQAPLRAQRVALDRVRKDQGGSVANILARLFDPTAPADKLTAEPPYRVEKEELKQDIRRSMLEATEKIDFKPNESQRKAIEYALQRRISLIRGPPGTGKTRVASLLIATALGMKHGSETDAQDGNTPRVLAVTHSNGAADVLLEGLLQMGVPAVRLGRPASVSAHLQHRTIIAMSEKMPSVVLLRNQSRDMTLSSQERSAAAFGLRQAMIDVQQMITQTAPVVVTSCIGAHQLFLGKQDGDGTGSEGDACSRPSFRFIVLDEAAQTTEPALVCALAAARAEQLVLVGDTRQLPPTITCMSLLDTLGVSPMARLEQCGVGEITLTQNYRMPPSLMKHPSEYFYKGLVSCAPEILLKEDPCPAGFRWPSSEPLAFVQVGDGESEVAHPFGGRSNPTEANLIIQLVLNILDAGDIHADKLAIISPYAKQVQLIRSELAARPSTQGIRVGTVDSFQGQETDLVLFSAVRSNSMKELGFIRDSRRLCVAITRARRGLILVGDQSTLKACRHWEALIESLGERGCITSREALAGPKIVLEESTLDDLFAEDDVLKRLFGEEDDMFDLASIE